MLKVNTQFHTQNVPVPPVRMLTAVIQVERTTGSQFTMHPRTVTHLGHRKKILFTDGLEHFNTHKRRNPPALPSIRKLQLRPEQGLRIPGDKGLLEAFPPGNPEIGNVYGHQKTGVIPEDVN